MNQKKNHEFLIDVAWGITITLGLYVPIAGFLISFAHPELTQMQVFLMMIGLD